MTITATPQEVCFEELPGCHGCIGLIKLNRPQALNACNQNMFAKILAQLSAWRDDARITAVMIYGEGDKAFCAGGDIRALYTNGPERSQTSLAFFSTEYQCNVAIARFPKPYIAWLNGITMGGGIGLSIYGSHRIGTEKLQVAMPEIAIGLFPDVGGGYFLPRLPAYSGWYLGLTGARIGWQDAEKIGIVNHILPSQQLSTVLEELCRLDLRENPHARITSKLQELERSPQPRIFQHSAVAPVWCEYHEEITSCFSQLTLVDILQKLTHSQSSWAKTAIESIEQGSPLSVKLTYAMLVHGRQHTLEEEIQAEFNMVQHILCGHDLYEGVRAMLIDKDKQPRWQHLGLSAVTEAEVAEYFKPAAKALSF